MPKVYVGVLPQGTKEELSHWKYIKRERVNGKWVYTYDEPKAVANAKNAVTNTAKKVGNAISDTAYHIGNNVREATGINDKKRAEHYRGIEKEKSAAENRSYDIYKKISEYAKEDAETARRLNNLSALANDQKAAHQSRADKYSEQSKKYNTMSEAAKANARSETAEKYADKASDYERAANRMNETANFFLEKSFEDYEASYDAMQAARRYERKYTNSIAGKTEKVLSKLSSEISKGSAMIKNLFSKKKSNLEQ